MSSKYNLHYEKIGKETHCIEDEILFEIPSSWEWIRLGSIGNFSRGNGIKRSEIRPQGFECIRYGEIYTTYNISINKVFSFIDDNLIRKSKIAEYGDILMTLTGENKTEIGKSIAFLGSKIAVGGDIAIYSNHRQCPLYMAYLLNSPYAINIKSNLATGDIIVHISCDKLASILIPLPPLSEQKRIVDKLEEILPLVEKYKENKEKLDELNLNFPSKLKKSILDYAIKGKLVEQNLEDESVEILLQKIREEKQRLIKDKKIKADKFPQSTIFIGEDNSPYEKIGKETRCIEDEIPFEIPQSWSWVRLGEICDIINGFTPLRSNMDFWQNGDIPWFTIDDMRECGRQISSTRQFISQKAIGENSKRLLPPNSILLCCTASIGEYAITKIPLTTNQQFNGIVIKTKYKNFCNAKFLFWVMPTLKSTLLNLAGKTTFEFVSVQKVSQILIPLPPLPEQKCIVAKIEELLKFVDILQSSPK